MLIAIHSTEQLGLLVRATLKTILGDADRLIDQIASENAVRLRAAPTADINELKSFMAGERRLLDTVRHIVLAEMVRQLDSST